MSSVQNISNQEPNPRLNGLLAAQQNLLAEKRDFINILDEELVSFTADLAKVDEFLSGWRGASTFLYNAFVGVDNQPPDVDLMIIPNEQLSSDDLNRKHEMLAAAIAEMNEKRQSLLAEASVIEASIEQLKDEQFKINEDSKAINDRELFTNNQADFWRQVLLPGVVLSAHPAEVYASTDRIISVADLLDQNVDFKKMVEAWVIVSQARDIAAAKNNPSLYKESDAKVKRQLQRYDDKYKQAAAKFFNIFADHLPVELQPLKRLYEHNPDAVDVYLNMLYTIQSNKNYDVKNAELTKQKIPLYVNMLNGINQDVRDIERQQVLTKLRAIRGFNALSIDVQRVLADQQVYVDNLIFDLSSLPKDDSGLIAEKQNEMQQLAAKLQDNITAAILNSDLGRLAEDQELQKQLNRKGQELRIITFGKDLSEKPLTLGGGMGLAWLLGGPSLMSALVFASVAKSAASAYYAEAPELEEEQKFATSMAAVDYRYLEDQDRFWGVETATPIGKMNVIKPEYGKDFEQMQNDAKDKLNNWIESRLKVAYVQDKIDTASDRIENVHNNINTGLTQWTKTLKMVGAAVLFLTLFGLVILAVASPPLWPLSVTFAVLLLAGSGAYIVRDVYNNNRTILQAAKRFGIELLGTLTDIRDTVRDGFRALFTSKAATVELPQEVISKKVVQQEEFAFDAEQLRALNEISPGFAAPLMQHFNNRVAELKEMIRSAQTTDPATGKIVYQEDKILQIGQEIDLLTKDWQELKNRIGNPREFRAYMNEYLTRAYAESRERFIAIAQEQQKNVADAKKYESKMKVDLSNHSSALTFSEKPNFDMHFERDFKQERAKLEDLRELKEKLAQSKFN